MNIFMTFYGHLKGVLKACSGVPKVYFFWGRKKKDIIRCNCKLFVSIKNREVAYTPFMLNKKSLIF